MSLRWKRDKEEDVWYAKDERLGGFWEILPSEDECHKDFELQFEGHSHGVYSSSLDAKTIAEAGGLVYTGKLSW